MGVQVAIYADKDPGGKKFIATLKRRLKNEEIRAWQTQKLAPFTLVHAGDRYTKIRVTFVPAGTPAFSRAAKAGLLVLSEAVHAEVKPQGVTITAVCPGPVPSGFQEASDAGYFAEKLPKLTFVAPERVARDALHAADRGKISVIPGGLHVRLAFGPNRRLPRWLVLPISKRLMARA